MEALTIRRLICNEEEEKYLQQYRAQLLSLYTCLRKAEKNFKTQPPKEQEMNIEQLLRSPPEQKKKKKKNVDCKKN